jgi:hypothetical protein
VAYLAIFFAHLSDYFYRISCPHMLCAGAVAYFAAGVLEMGCLFLVDKAAGLAIPCGMAGIALPDLFRREMFHPPFNALKRDALLGIGHEIFILLRMALFAGQ